MHSKQQPGALHNRFWETFGRYMAPVLSASGGKISWTNYHTGLPGISFRMYVAGSEAYVGIEISDEDNAARREYFSRFRLLKAVFEAFSGEGWHWEEEAVNYNGHAVSRIYSRLENVSISNEADWPAIISFLKPRIISLDGFWHDNFPFFEIVG